MMIRTIHTLTRLNNSVNGNPRYRVTFTDGSAHDTSADAGFCYGLTNPEYRNVEVIVTLTRAGRIANIETMDAARKRLIRKRRRA